MRVTALALVGLVAVSSAVAISPSAASAVQTRAKPDVYCYTSDAYLTGPRPKLCYLFLAGSDGFGMVLMHARWNSARSGKADIGYINSEGIYRMQKNRKFKFKRVRPGEAGLRFYTVIRAAGTNYLMF